MGKRRRPKGRLVNGILVFDKPIGITSNAALQQVKSLFKAQKAGHTGSLDPLADGMLPICFGIATRLSAFLLDADKHYWVRIRLGETTTTGDTEGEILETRSTDGIDKVDIAAVLPQFMGTISQLPPMYSALKHQGKRLYQLAREGIEVEREPRQVEIYDLQLGILEGNEFELQVHCSKGTYVRTLAEDIGQAIGCGAHVVALRRTGVGPYTQYPMLSMQQLEQAAGQGMQVLDALLLPPDSALTNWPAIHLNPDMGFYLKQGQPLIVPKAPTEGWVRLYQGKDEFLGVGEIMPDGRVAPRRLLGSFAN